MFYRSRRRLALLYSALMFALFCLIICLSYQGMVWAVSSEQARELSGQAQDVAGAEALMQAQDISLDDLGYRERIFFYSYDLDGNLVRFSRAPQRLEADVAELIDNNQVPFGDVAVFEQKENKQNVVMMTATYVELNGKVTGIIYVGKDISVLYKGLSKFTYFLGIVSMMALIIAIIIGIYISGRIMEPMQIAYERQKQFTADASHELRTPLSVIMASADLLYNDPSIQSPFIKQVIEDVKDEVKKMSNLVGNLMAIARSDNHAEKMNIQEFDLSDSLQQVLRKMKPMADKKHIATSSSIASPLSYVGDEQKIKQLVLIFVDNALKYTPEGGSIRVTAEAVNGKRIRFSVQDTGIGLSEEDCKKVFERFYRVDKARSREMGGSGLGLAIAKDIVDAHGGYIYLDSELGKGSTFTVELPQQRKI